MRLNGKTAVIVGAGQTPGKTIGNGRAAAILFAREGARVLLVDRDAASARETQAMIDQELGADAARASVLEADITREDDCRRAVAVCIERYGRLDILHNNVGIGAGDAEITALEEAAWDRIMDVNLKGAFLICKHAIAAMRARGGGAIVNISSLAAVAAATTLTAYKVSKAGLNALTELMAIGNAAHGIRVNAVMPGLIQTPMAIEGIARKRGISKEALIAERNSRVPLKGGMGTAWDVAHAALFLASDEAKFITGVILPVDGGQSVRVG